MQLCPFPSRKRARTVVTIGLTSVLACLVVVGCGGTPHNTAAVPRATTATANLATTVPGNPTNDSPSSTMARSVTFPGKGDSGPAIRTLQVGRSDARRVLILVPGWFEAAGALLPVADAVVQRSPETQVWAVDRREQGPVDLSHMGGDPRDAAEYYLGGHYTKADTGPASAWGLASTLTDLRRVVLAASDRGHRQVILGGHSWGATTAMVYAGWDFSGRPGYRDLSGLVVIDGGVHGSFAGEGYTYDVRPEQARARLAQIQQHPIDTSLALLYGVKESETPPILFQLAAQRALKAPTALSTLASELPPSFRPPTAVTNRALLGWLFDTHVPIPDLRVHSGHLTSSGQVRDWIDTGATPISRLAETLAGPNPTGFEWYWPARLTLDLEAADPFAETATTQLLGLRLTHTTEITTPLYVFQTGLTHGTVIKSARWVVAHSKITRADYQSDNAMSHIEPLVVPPTHNKFINTIVPFLSAVPAN